MHTRFDQGEYEEALQSMKNHLTFDHNHLLRIILIWILLTITSVCYMSTLVTIRKPVRFMNMLWTLDNVHYRQITLL
jgi:hypothetical protein